MCIAVLVGFTKMFAFTQAIFNPYQPMAEVLEISPIITAESDVSPSETTGKVVESRFPIISSTCLVRFRSTRWRLHVSSGRLDHGHGARQTSGLAGSHLIETRRANGLYNELQIRGYTNINYYLHGPRCNLMQFSVARIIASQIKR